MPQETAHLRLASESGHATGVPSLPELYTRAAQMGLLPGSDSIRELLWASVDAESYSKWINVRLDQADVPKEYRRFDHDFAVKMVKDKFKLK